MVIDELGLLHFRNYNQLHLKFSDQVNIFIGKNGQGKSNLAEGIYLINHLESFRTTRLVNLIQFNQPIAHIKAKILKKRIPFQSQIELSKKGRRVSLEDVQVKKLSQYITEFYAIIFNPDSLYFFRHFSHQRRAFFDRFLSFMDPGYLDLMREFRSVHAQKNKLLKSGQLSSLHDWNALFLDKSYGIFNVRKELVDWVNDLLPGFYSELTGNEQRLRLRFFPSLTGDPTKWPLALEKVSSRESHIGHALIGPHRDDFRLIMEDGRSDEFFSQGEYRISQLALKLAINDLVEKRMGFRPVLILDDLFSELDGSVRANLRRALAASPNQIFVTATERPEGFGDSGTRIMEIRNGGIE